MRAAAALSACALWVAAPLSAADPSMPAGFVDAATVVPGLRVDMRYTGADNFVGSRIDGYEANRCILTRSAAAALARVQADLAREGVGLRAFDCYRPQRAVAHFVRWSRDAADVATKPAYYPEIDKSDLFAAGYIAERSGHSRGSTVDLTLVDRRTGAELDMGGPFDFFGPRSASTTPLIGAVQQRNRDRLRRAMTARGFAPYGQEWWHFTLRKEPFPRTYFDFPVR